MRQFTFQCDWYYAILCSADTRLHGELFKAIIAYAVERQRPAEQIERKLRNSFVLMPGEDSEKPCDILQAIDEQREAELTQALKAL